MGLNRHHHAVLCSRFSGTKTEYFFNVSVSARPNNMYYVVHVFASLYVSVNSMPDQPPRATSGDLHVLTARGSGFRPIFFALGSGF